MKFELNIYGENDEILKKYETNHASWGVFVKAVDLQEKIKDSAIAEQVAAAGEIVKQIFAGLTDEELMRADVYDVMNTMKQLTAAAGGIKGSKNA